MSHIMMLELHVLCESRKLGPLSGRLGPIKT